MAATQRRAVEQTVIVVGPSDGPPARLNEVRESVHLVRVFATDEYGHVVGALSDGKRSPDAAARACPATAAAAARLRADGRAVTVHGRVTDRTTAAVVGVASAVDADRVVVSGRSVDASRLTAAGPWRVSTETTPQWYLTD